MNKLIIVVLALAVAGVVFQSNEATSQIRPFKAEQIVGDTDAAVGRSKVAFDKATEALRIANEAKDLAAKRTGYVGAQQGLDGNVVKDLRAADGNALRQIAIIRKWEKKLPRDIVDQIRGIVDQAVAEVVTGDGDSDVPLAGIEEIRRVLTDKIAAIDARVLTLEGDMRTAKADIVELREDVDALKEGGVPKGVNRGVNLTPEFLTVFNFNAANFLFGLRLNLPAAKSNWDVNLEGLVGVTQKKDFSWSVGFDVTKKLKPWVSLGPSLNWDALDNTAVVGLTSMTATVGLRTDFHVNIVDFTVGGGMGLRARDGELGFGWRFLVGLGIRCF